MIVLGTTPMANTVNSNYQLETSYFSFWQVMGFILVFAFIGSWVLRTFAGAPQISSFTVSNQAYGNVEFTAKASKKPADNLAVTNSCHALNSAAATTQTAAFSDWTLDTKTGYTGRVSFSVPAGQKCLAYVHAGNDVIRLAELSYTSL
jgi:hypothetical protein